MTEAISALEYGGAHLVLHDVVKAEHDVGQAAGAVGHDQLLDGRADRPDVHLHACRVAQHRRLLRHRARQQRALRMLHT